MTEEQAVEVLSMIEGAYPHFMKGTEQQIKGKLKIWMYHLREMDYDRAIKNLHKHVGINEYPPTIAQIKPQTTKPQGNNYITDWAEFEKMFGDD